MQQLQSILAETRCARYEDELRLAEAELARWEEAADHFQEDVHEANAGLPEWPAPAAATTGLLPSATPAATYARPAAAAVVVSAATLTTAPTVCEKTKCALLTSIFFEKTPSASTRPACKPQHETEPNDDQEMPTTRPLEWFVS